MKVRGGQSLDARGLGRSQTARTVSDMFWRFYVRWLMLSDASRLFDELHDIEWYQRLHEGWLGDLDCAPSKRLLEIGCGTGRLAATAKCRGLNVTAVDRSRSMLRRARARVRESDDIEFRRADVQALPFPDGTFDCVIAASLINIVDDPNGALGEMARVLRPAGVLSYLVPGERMDKRRVDRFVSVHRLSGFDAEALRAWGAYPTKMDRSRCLGLAEDTGLRAIRVSTRLDGMVYEVTGSRA